MLIDTHSHVYLEEFDSDRMEMIQRALDQGLSNILLPNIDSSTIAKLNALTKSNPTLFKGMMGLHPGSVKANYKEELKAIKTELYSNPYIAVGEIGIDLYWDRTFINEQIIAFEQQIEWALDLNIPIVIHARESFNEIVAVLEKYRNSSLTGVFHCFSGSDDDLQKALSFERFYLGIGGVLTFKNGGLDKLMEKASIERLVLETDAPYLAPAPHRGKRNEPAFISLVAEKLANIKGASIEMIKEKTTKNAMNLFNLAEDE